MSDPLLFEKAGSVARVTLNRPEAFNALNGHIRAGLRDAITEVHNDDAIRVVILSGNGRGFCSGTDLTERHADTTAQFLDREYRPVLNGIATSSKIWIAQVHGSAAGIGAALAMNCDLLTIADDASIYMAFAPIGLVPDGGSTWLLHRAMGGKRALQAILEGRKIPAAEALDYGLANAMSPASSLAAETEAMANRIAGGAPLAIAAAKRLIRSMDGKSYEEAISLEGQEQTILSVSDDAREGVSAFFEKRKPQFQGR